jgi:regulator of sirC expression with transglutaminase-like and TPR domain
MRKAMRDAYLGFDDPAAATEWLRAQGRLPDPEIDLIGCALALAALDRPRVGLRRYVDHLDAVAAAVADRAGADAPLDDRIAALNEVMFDELGYVGDTETYDDLQNTNLIRVIDRRRGLPIVLSLLYMHGALAQGWPAEGINFPGHFVLRLSAGADRAIVDPFNGGRTIEAAELRELLKLSHGEEAELTPEHFAVASKRDILLRLQNNLKLRLIRLGKLDGALDVVERMLLFAPDNAALWHASGVLNAELGRLADAIAALQRTAGLDADGALQHRVAALMQALRSRLN